MPNSNKINYTDLFEIWADFDDSQSKKEAKRLIEEHGLGQYDAMSFMGFCYGYYKAVQLSERRNHDAPIRSENTV